MKELKKSQYIRGVIQIIFFLLAPSIFATAFSGVKYIVTQFHNREGIEFTTFLSVLIVILVYTILFGRFFCGYACAFGTLGDFLYGISSRLQKKFKIKGFKLQSNIIRKLQYIKYVVLFTILILCFQGVYVQLRGISPWDVFSMITSGNLQFEGYMIGLGFLMLIMIGMCFIERFFCQFLCPMGAVFSLMPIFPYAILKRDRESCIKNCNACQVYCPVRLSIDGDSQNSGECFRCGKCSNICPKQNVHCGIKNMRGSETFLVIVKAVILFAIIYFWI